MWDPVSGIGCDPSLGIHGSGDLFGIHQVSREGSLFGKTRCGIDKTRTSAHPSSTESRVNSGLTPDLILCGLGLRHVLLTGLRGLFGFADRVLTED